MYTCNSHSQGLAQEKIGAGLKNNIHFIQNVFKHKHSSKDKKCNMGLT